MPNQTQINQEGIYRELNGLHNSSPINNGDEQFNFWIRPRASKNNEWYRFNRGNTGYTNIGIVKVGSRSALQIVGFHTTDFGTYSLNILNRKVDYPRIKKGTTLSDTEVDVFLQHMVAALPQPQQTFNNNADAAQWMYDTYQLFFNEVKAYDSNNNTPFYNILKITDTDFNDNRTTNDQNMAPIFNPPYNPLQQGGNGGAQSQQYQATPMNQILYGPPGTGKTYHTVDKAVEIIDSNLAGKDWKDKKKDFDQFIKDGRIVFTTFHQSMSYEDFIEGIKPETDSKTKQVEYPVKDGFFKKLCTEAINHPDQNYVMIIDEINRGNVSQIFGELITLLEADKRLGKDFELTVKLPYSNQNNDFGVPSNLYIIGTMNTADRSVEALDTALRRRFSFVEMMPNPSLLNTVTIQGLSVGLEDLLNVINQRIVLLKDREHQIGHSYFMKCKDLADLKAVFKNNIVPLLQEYFYGNYYNIGLVLGEEFVKKENPVGKFGKGFDYDGDAEPGWRMLSDDEWDRLDMNVAITALMN